MTFRNWKATLMYCVIFPLLCTGAFIAADLTLCGRRETRLDKIEVRVEALECSYESAS